MSFITGYNIMIVTASINACTKNVVQLSSRIQGQMGGSICGVTSRRPSNSCCFRLSSGRSMNNCSGVLVSQKVSYPSSSDLDTFQGKCCGPGLTKSRCHLQPLTIKRFIRARLSPKRHLEISLAFQSINNRPSAPKQGILHQTKCNAGPLNWQVGCASASLVFGLLVCYSSSTPVHAQALPEEQDEEEENDLSFTQYSHGKKVFTDYSVIGEQQVPKFLPLFHSYIISWHNY